MIHEKSKSWYLMRDESGKIVNFVMVAIVVAVFAFSLYMLLTTKNTIIVVNEAAVEPKEVFVVGNNPPSSEVPAPNPRIEILDTGVGFLNVRDGASSQAKKIGIVKPGEVYEYVETKDNWYHIVHPELENAWVSGQYAKEIDRSSNLFGGQSDS